MEIKEGFCTFNDGVVCTLIGNEAKSYVHSFTLLLTFVGKYFFEEFNVTFIKKGKNSFVESLSRKNFPILVKNLANHKSESRSFLELKIIFEKLVQGESNSCESCILSSFDDREDIELTVGLFTSEQYSIHEHNLKKHSFDILWILEDDKIRLSCSAQKFPDGKFENRMMKNLVIFANSVSTSPESPIINLNVISQKEHDFQVYELNRTKSFPKTEVLEDWKTLRHVFEDMCNKFGDFTAVEYLDESITFEELNVRTNQLSHYIAKTYPKLKPGDFLGISLDKSIELIICILSCWKLGCVYFPIDPKFPEERIRFSIEDTGCKFVFCNHHNLAKFEFLKLTTTVIPIDQDFFSPLLDSDIFRSSLKSTNPKNSSSSSSSSLAYVSYTSGSTGTPKAVVHDHKGAWNVYSNLPELLHFDPSDRILFFSSISFDEHLNTLSTLFFGVSLIICPEAIRYDPNELWKFIESKNINIVKLTPTVLTSLPKKKFITSNVKSISIIGEKCDPETMKFWSMNVPYFVHLYGSQETILDHTKLWSKDDHPGNVGSLIPKYKCYVLNPFQKPVPIGVVGEVYISGPTISKRGYLNRPEINKIKYVINPFSQDDNGDATMMYRTGDFGCLTMNGELIFSKRKDHMVKISGMRIELGEIEESIQKSGFVQKVVVDVKKMGQQQNRNILVCFFISSEEREEEGENNDDDRKSDQIREYLGKMLPYYMVPHIFVSRKTFPLTVSGKLDKQQLLKDFNAIEYTRENYIPPRTKEETKMQSIFTDVLFPSSSYSSEEEEGDDDDEKIGVLDNFYALGGSSLTLILLKRKIEETFDDIKIDFPKFLQIPDVSIKNLCEIYFQNPKKKKQQERKEERNTKFVVDAALTEEMKSFLGKFDENGEVLDEENGILFRHMKESDVEECVNLDISAWHQMNPIYIFTGITEEEDRKTTRMYLSAAIRDGTSLVAVNTKTGKIILMNGGYSEKSSNEINIPEEDEDDGRFNNSLFLQEAVGALYSLSEKKIRKECLVEPILNAGSLARILEEEDDDNINISEVYYKLELLLQLVGQKKGYKTFIDDPNSLVTQEMARMGVFPNSTVHPTVKFDEFEYPEGSGSFPLIGLREYYLEFVRREFGEDKFCEVKNIEFDGLFCCTRDLRIKLI